jgi:hypothetical protein
LDRGDESIPILIAFCYDLQALLLLNKRIRFEKFHQKSQKGSPLLNETSELL